MLPTINYFFHLFEECHFLHNQNINMFLKKGLQHLKFFYSDDVMFEIVRNVKERYFKILHVKNMHKNVLADLYFLIAVLSKIGC